MGSYILDALGGLRRKSDNASIPRDEGNTDYQIFLASKEAPDAYVEPLNDAASRQRRATFDADNTRADLITKLASMSPTQISNYVDNNTANLADVRVLLKKMLLVMAQM